MGKLEKQSNSHTLQKSKISFRKGCENFTGHAKILQTQSCLVNPMRNPKGCVNPFGNPKNPFRKPLRNPKAFANFQQSLKTLFKGL